MVDFFVQMPDLKLGFQINLVIVFRAQTVSRLGAVLAHHDDRSLYGGETGEDQIEKDERIRIERSGSEQRDVRTDPHEDNSAKCNEEFPTTTELGDAVRKTFTKGEFLFELLLDVAGENLVLLQTFDHFLVEGGKLADLFLQNVFYVILSEFAQIIETDEPFAIQGW